MVLLRNIIGGLNALFHKGRRNLELDDELRTYLEAATEDKVRRGMSYSDALRASRVEMGSMQAIKQEVRSSGWECVVESLWHDLCYGARQILRSPGFSAVAIFTLALGIGANTVIFSAVNALFLRGLPVPNPDGIVSLRFTQKNDTGMGNVSYADFEDIQRQADAYVDLFAYQWGGAGISTGDRADHILANYVTGAYFSALGVKPALGRLILPAEGRLPGANAVIVLGYSYWETRFGRDPSIIGKVVRVGGRPVTIVGVSEKGFRGLLPALLHVQAYLPLNMLSAEQDPGTLTKRSTRTLLALGRLRPGVSFQQAGASMQLVANRLSRQYPDTDAGAAIGLLPQKETLLNPIARPGDYQKQRIGVALFLALPILVLLLACFNVANILLVRATAREHEMAVRAALGAGRGRLVRQLLTESLLLAFLGCGAGLFLGSLGAGFFESIRVSIGVPLNLDFSFDWRVFASAAAAAVLAGLVVGLMPAVRASRIGPGGALGEGRTVVRGGHRLRNILVTAEVAGSIVLLIVAGLFTRSLGKVQRMDLGFNPAHLVNLTMDPHDAGYSAAQAQQFYKDLLVRVRALPGVRSASVAFTYPSSTAAFSSPVLVEGRPLRPGEAAPTVLTNRVSPGYFETLETPILSGRAFRDSDTATAPRVAVVNQTMARQLWPNQEALGKRFHMNSAAEPWIEVTGIAADSKYVSVLAKSVPYFYVPLAQYDVSFGTLLVRTETAPGSMTGSVEEQVRMLAPGLPVIDVRTMEQALNSGLTGFYAFHLGADLAAALGILGLALAIVGVYGVISYSTSQRTHEIGLRMALGASQGDIWRVISPQGVAIVVAGIAIGILAAFAVTRVMAGFLYGVSAQDPLTYAGVCTLVAAVALLACYLPARRATKLDPMVALRYE